MTTSDERRATWLAAYDTLRGERETPSALGVELVGPVRLVRFAGGRGFVTYRDLGGLDAAGVDELVGEIVRRVAVDASFERVEWKTRAHDAAPGLHEALLARGFVPDETEAIMIGELAGLVRATVPDGVTVRQVVDAADVHALAATADRAFGDEPSEASVAALLRRQSVDPDLELWVAEVAGVMVSTGRLEPVRGTPVAGFWGGATLPAWRGRGAYRAVVAARARSALEAGYTLAHSDSTAASRPILERSGLVAVSSTTPYRWRRSAPAVVG